MRHAAVENEPGLPGIALHRPVPASGASRRPKLVEGHLILWSAAAAQAHRRLPATPHAMSASEGRSDPRSCNEWLHPPGTHELTGFAKAAGLSTRTPPTWCMRKTNATHSRIGFISRMAALCVLPLRSMSRAQLADNASQLHLLAQNSMLMTVHQCSGNTL